MARQYLAEVNTFFHATANAGAALGLHGRLPWLRHRTVFWASLAPDVPLLFLTLWYFLFVGVDFGPRYDDLFFNDPVWIVLHNLFHAPFVALAVAGAGLLVERARAGLLSFAFGIGLHSLVDIFTHHHDGPLLLFPFEWSIRFSSPVSYWDPDHFGRILGPIDLGLTLVFGVLLTARWIRRRGSATRGRRGRAAPQDRGRDP